MLALDFDYRYTGYGEFTDFIATASQTASMANS
jgi:hypothetical protein